jgi:flagellin-like protein
MYIMNRYFSKRGVSQVIAALLLIAIAVAAAILLYVFSIGLLGSLGTGGGQQTKEQLIMEAYNFPTASSGQGSLTLTVRNVGPASVNIGSADFFINGVMVSPSGGACSTTLTPGGSCTTTLTYAGTSLVAGAAYPLKIVSPTGGVFSYSIIYGGAS